MKECNSGLTKRWMAACIRNMKQNMRVNEWNEVQYEVKYSSHKYSTVPQLGFLFCDSSEVSLDIHTLY